MENIYSCMIIDLFVLHLLFEDVPNIFEMNQNDFEIFTLGILTKKFTRKVTVPRAL
jgi:hypothetical protein